MSCMLSHSLTDAVAGGITTMAGGADKDNVIESMVNDDNGGTELQVQQES